MENRDKYWQMFTESGDPLAYVRYKQYDERERPAARRRKPRALPHENL